MAEPVMRPAGASAKPLPRRFNFTLKVLQGVTCPAGRDRVWVYDLKVRALAFCVTAAGKRSFYVVKKWQGTTRKYPIGGLELSLEQARQMALADLVEFAQGKDPMAKRRSIRDSITLQELFDRYTKEHAQQRCTPATLRSDKSRFDVCFEDWKGRKLATIRPADARAKHAEIARKTGQVNANRAMQLLRRMCRWARLANPVTEVDFFEERERERFLQPGEAPRFFQALEQEPNATIKDYIYLSLYTGARRSNVQAMRWDEIDFASSTWIIPAGKSKSGAAMHVHLPAAAVAILKARKDNGSEWVLPTSASKSGHITEPRFAWDRLLERAKIKDLHLHDLRRSLGSWMAAGGASLPVIGKQLGHHDVATTAIYSRLNIDPTRQFVDTAVTAMQAAAQVKQDEKRPDGANAPQQDEPQGEGTSKEPSKE